MLLHPLSALSTMRRSLIEREKSRANRFEEVQNVSRKARWLRLCALAGIVLAVSACATPPSDPVARAEFDKTNDPMEPMNRKILDFNLFLDRILIKPAARRYRDRRRFLYGSLLLGPDRSLRRDQLGILSLGRDGNRRALAQYRELRRDPEECHRPLRAAAQPLASASGGRAAAR